VEPHWIDRRDGQPSHVAAGDAPVTMKAYDTTEKAKKHLAAAKMAVDGPPAGYPLRNGSHSRRNVAVGPRTEWRSLADAVEKGGNCGGRGGLIQFL
jgi:hypothetical protein